MLDNYNLKRFTDAQAGDYETVLAEIRAARKRSHWMWYIFPQVEGLGFSETSRYYGIKGIDEAVAYLSHPVLGPRLTEISGELLNIKTTNATQVFGSPDDLKLRSSMTLFSSVPAADPVFKAVLDKFFNGEPDQKTLQLIGNK